MVVASSSPGRCRVEPYRSSAEVQPRSTLREVLMPKRVRGREEHHSLVFVTLDMREALSWWWNLSTMPLDCCVDPLDAEDGHDSIPQG